MTLPKNFFLIRHGKSEGNAFNQRSRAGDDSEYTDEFRNRPSSDWRLTNTGINQVRAAGTWLQDNFDEPFHRLYASEYVRAIESAYELGIETELDWYLDINLRERDYGQMDVLTEEQRATAFAEEYRRRKMNPFIWCPPGGESIATTCQRADRTLGTLHRECSSQNVGAVCHGEMMWAFVVKIERMSQTKYMRLHLSRDPHDHFHNAQIIHYSRVNPAKPDGKLAPHLNWRRSICPWDTSKSTNEWEEVVRPRYSRDDLRKLFESYPRLIED